MKKITFFISNFANGGIEKVYINLCNSLQVAGTTPEILIGKLSKTDMIDQFDKSIKVSILNSSNPYLCQPKLIKYILKNKPDIIIADRHQSLLAAIISNKIINKRIQIHGTIHGHISSGFKFSWRNSKQQAKMLNKINFCLPDTNGIITVSKGVEEDFIRLFPEAREKVKTIYNPVVTDDLISNSNQKINHPWISDKKIPVILGVGRLSAQKDFKTLIRAFAELRKKLRSRLMIIGDGDEEKELQALANKLGIENDFSLLGFQKNPIAWMAHADLFVLSSISEGLGIVLIEAMAVGTPVVSTDCQSGPSEILEGGKYGPLVPVGDASALAIAMETALQRPINSEELRKRGLFFSSTNCANNYLKLLKIS